MYHNSVEYRYTEYNRLQTMQNNFLTDQHDSKEDRKELKEIVSIIFTLKNKVGGLVRALQAFQDLGISVLHIESRPSQQDDDQIDFLVDIEYDPKKMEQLGQLLRREVLTMVIGTYGDIRNQANEFPPPTPLSATASFGKCYPSV